MNLSVIWPRLFRNQLRFYSSKSKPKNHYESLGISPKCTQGEVKTAYYQLSMQHHPDKNQGNQESQQKFRDINEAYEVLGNVTSRRLYDRGLHFGVSSHIYGDRSEDKFYKSRENRSRAPPPAGRTPIYDFDEWSKMHYGATFRKQQENRRRTKAYHEGRQYDKDRAKMERFLFVFGLFFIICMFFVSNKDYDNSTFVRRNNKTYSRVNE